MVAENLGEEVACGVDLRDFYGAILQFARSNSAEQSGTPNWLISGRHMKLPAALVLKVGYAVQRIRQPP